MAGGASQSPCPDTTITFGAERRHPAAARLAIITARADHDIASQPPTYPRAALVVVQTIVTIRTPEFVPGWQPKRGSSARVTAPRSGRWSDFCDRRTTPSAIASVNSGSGSSESLAACRESSITWRDRSCCGALDAKRVTLPQDGGWNRERS